MPANQQEHGETREEQQVGHQRRYNPKYNMAMGLAYDQGLIGRITHITAQWHRNLALTETILPWATLWFVYFEEWLVSNEWQGGGEHPPVAEVA